MEEFLAIRSEVRNVLVRAVGAEFGRKGLLGRGLGVGITVFVVGCEVDRWAGS